jgi:hypothetical protein
MNADDIKDVKSVLERKKDKYRRGTYNRCDLNKLDDQIKDEKEDI